MSLKVEMIRPQMIAGDIVVTDGMSCSGKTLAASLISTLKRGELWIFDHLHEYLCVMHDLGRITQDAAETLVKMYVDIDIYNLMISRNTNFRKTDVSSAQNNLLEDRHRKRLDLKDGDRVVDEIKKERPILTLMAHYIFGQSQLLFDALGDRLKLYVVSVRHPLDLVESWYKVNWKARFGADPRDLQLCCTVNGKTVPWFAAGWEKEYLSLGNMEQTIRTTAWFIEKFERQYNRLSEQNRKKVQIIPFEPFVTNPEPQLRKLEAALETERTPLTEDMMKKLDIPRTTIPDDYLEKQREKVYGWIKREKVAKKYVSMLDQLCSNYEARYSTAGVL